MKADKKLEKIRSGPYTRLALNLLLTIFKLLAGISGHSVLLLSDAVRSFSDCINEAAKLLDSVVIKNPDKSHNYGHGKITTLFMGTGAIIIFFVSIETFSLGLENIFLLIKGKEFAHPETTALLGAFLILCLRSVFFAFTENKKSIEYENARDTESGLKSDFSEKRSFSNLFLDEKDPCIIDMGISAFVILGIAGSFLPGRIFGATDFLGAVLMSLYLLQKSGKLLYRVTDELIEASLDYETNQKIREIIERTEGVARSGEIKTRRIGKGIAINACIGVHDSLNIQRASEITNLVESRLKTAFEEDVYALIKVEPGSLKSSPIQNLNKCCEEGNRKLVI